MVEELNSSVLGTEKYWNDIYEKELLDFNERRDPGTEWFGRPATSRIVRWISSCANLRKESSIVDIGCGNGLLLLELAKLGYQNLIGVDYCEDALELAKSVFQQENFDKVEANWLKLDITQQTLIKGRVEKDLSVGECIKAWDTSENIPIHFEQCTFELCLDKGTYDAISLCPNEPKIKRMNYIKQVKIFLSGKSGLFVIASCNWTASELASHFTDFNLVKELPAPSFTFGGKTGQTVSTCVFQLKNDTQMK